MKNSQWNKLKGDPSEIFENFRNKNEKWKWKSLIVSKKVKVKGGTLAKWYNLARYKFVELCRTILATSCGFKKRVTIIVAFYFMSAD